MQIFHKVQKEVLHIFLMGELDEHTADYVKIKVDTILDNADYSSVIIDFKDLGFMDSTGIGMLIGRYKKLLARKIPIYLKNPNSQMERIFKMSGIYRLMPKIA